MASTLQEQLKRIASAAGVITSKHKPSLLFTYQEAADIGIHDIYQVASQGFDQLCRADPRFQIFRKTLFNQVSQSIDRDQQTEEENAKLDASISSFCALLSGYFLLPAAFKTLEYLIRKFRVNEYNVQSLMYAALPYHATNDFVRLVQILSLEGTPFQFLAPMQSSGAALHRSILVERCLTDQALLRFVLDMSKLLGHPQSSSKSAMPFYAATLCEIITSKATINEDLIITLLPYLSHGLTEDVIPEYRAASCMIVVQLCTRASLSGRFIEGLVVELCRSTTPTSVYETLLVLCHIAVTQHHFTSFPESALKNLVKLPGMMQELRSVVSKAGLRAQRLLMLLCSAASDIRLLGGSNNKLADFLVDAIRSIAPMSETVAKAIAERMIDAATVATVDGQEEQSVIRVLNALDVRYATVVEKVLNRVLRACKNDDNEDENDDGAGVGRTKKKTKKKSTFLGAMSKEKENRLHALLQKAFASSLRAPLLDAGTTLAVAVDAATPSVRVAALQKLDDLVEQQHNEEAEVMLKEVFPRRLADDNPVVVLATLELPSLLRLPSISLLETFESVLHAALTAAEASETAKEDRATYRAVAKRVIKLLTGVFTEKHPGSMKAAGDIVSASLISSPHVRSVAHVALKCGRETGHPLLKNLGSIDPDAFFAEHVEKKDDDEDGTKGGTKKEGAVVKKSKESSGRGSTRQQHKDDDQPTTPGGSMKHGAFKKYSDTMHNQSVLQALASSILRDMAAQDAVVRLLSSSYQRSAALAAIVCNIAVHMKDNQAVKKRLAGDLLRHCCQADSNRDASFSLSAGFAKVSLISVRNIHKQHVDSQDRLVAFSYSDEKQGMPGEECILAAAQGVLDMETALSELILACLDGIDVDTIGQLYASNGFKNLFVQACTLSATNTAPWAPVQKAIVTKISEQYSATEFLAKIWGSDTILSPEAGSSDIVVSPYIQAISLKLWAEFGAISPPLPSRSSKSGRASADDSAAATIDIYPRVPRLLSMLSHPQKDVRIAALYAVSTVCNAIDVWWPAAEKNHEKEKHAITSLLSSFEVYSSLITGDSIAAELLLQRTVERAHAGMALPAVASKGGKKLSAAASNSKKVSQQQQQQQHLHGRGSQLGLSTEDAQFIAAFLLHQLPSMHSASTLPGIPFILHVVYDIAPPEQLLSAAVALFNSLTIDSASSAMKVPSSETEHHVAEELCQVFNPSILKAVLDHSIEHMPPFVDLFTIMLSNKKAAAATSSSNQSSLTSLRSRFITAISPEVFESLPSENMQRQIFLSLMGVSSKDEDALCRGLAHNVLTALQVNAALLVPLLSVDGLPGSTSDRRGPSTSQRRRKNASTQDRLQTVDIGDAWFARCLECLEILQWKEEMKDATVLIHPLQGLLKGLIAHGSQDDTDTVNGDGAQDGRRESTVRAYAMQLALSVLVSLAKHSPATKKLAVGKTEASLDSDDGGFDFELAVQCARHAPDAAVRSVSLSLISILALSAPQSALEHVLNVVSLVGDVSHELIDAHSNAIANKTLAAVSSAWIQSSATTASSGKLKDLVHVVVEASIKAPASRRIVLLQALLSSMEYCECMTMILVELLQRQLDAPTVGGDVVDSWMFDAATALLKQGSLIQQIQAMDRFLFVCLEEEAKKLPTSPLVLLGTALVTTRLQNMPAYQQDQSNDDDQEEDHMDDDEDAIDKKIHKRKTEEQTAAAYESLMQRALTHLHYIGTHAAKKPSSSQSVLLEKARDAAYELIATLSKVMSPAAFIAGLVALVGHDNDAIQRKALHLLGSTVATLPAQHAQPKAAFVVDDAVTRIVLEVLPSLQAILDAESATTSMQVSSHRSSRKKPSSSTATTSALTRQTALTTLSMLSDVFAERHPQEFVAIVPFVLALSHADHRGTAECASALATVASMIRSLKKQYIPVLPITSSAVLAAATHAAGIIHEGTKDGDDEPGGEISGMLNIARLELAAALSAVLSLVETLGAFVAPQLGDIFAIILDPTVLSCSFARCSETAARIQTEITKDIPMRLLLAPLSHSLDATMASGAEASCAMLSMLRSAVSTMDGTAVATYHEAVFALLLRALDVRRKRILKWSSILSQHPSPSKDRESDSDMNAIFIKETQQIEDAAISVFVELTLKLSESRFKPLFFRFLEWATSIPAATAAVSLLDDQEVEESHDIDEAIATLSKSTLPRLVTFFSTVNVLTEQLRSVFTAYHQTFMESTVAALQGKHLLAPVHGGAQPTKKKRKKSSDTAMPLDQHDLPHHLRHLDPLLRLNALHALHRCFLYDTSSFLDEARFDTLLSPLVAQLEESPDGGVLGVLPSDEALEASLHAEALHLDVLARATIGCLSQMALASGGSNDVRWRPLNRAILMVTRSPEVRSRLAALETAAGLVNALQEEYLPLLPEALPFFAELLEDDQHVVEARATEVLRVLEEISGEDLKAYLK